MSDAGLNGSSDHRRYDHHSPSMTSKERCLIVSSSSSIDGRVALANITS